MMTMLFSICQDGEKSFHIPPFDFLFLFFTFYDSIFMEFNPELVLYIVNPSSINFLLYVEYD